jgi:heat-inducible transcriptional repressor
LLEIANLLSERFRGFELNDIKSAVHDDHCAAGEDVGELEQQAFAMMRDLLPAEDSLVEVQVAGTDKLLQTDDFAEIERVRSLLATLDDRHRIFDEIRRALSSGPTQVLIGRESEITASGELGMVTTLFFKDGKRAGAVGVMGPKRMDYTRILPVVEYVGDSLTKMLQEPGAMHG